MNRYNRWNNIVGWAVFAVAALTYLATMEPSASLWDCSEFIATSYKLEVGHPPGAPLFMMMARLATMLAPSTEYVPLMVNAMNSLASAFCILFMFWTVTHLGRRIYSAQGRELTDANMWTVLGAGAVGALAYTFTDTFWFSAYEGEVYALSSMFTALSNGLVSALISFLRTLLFQVTVVLVLPIFFDVEGVWASVLVAEVFALCVTTFFFVRMRKRYNYV